MKGVLLRRARGASPRRRSAAPATCDAAAFAVRSAAVAGRRPDGNPVRAVRARS